jgi:hypothetical protein
MATVGDLPPDVPLPSSTRVYFSRTTGFVEEFAGRTKVIA